MSDALALVFEYLRARLHATVVLHDWRRLVHPPIWRSALPTDAALPYAAHQMVQLVNRIEYRQWQWQNDLNYVSSDSEGEEEEDAEVEEAEEEDEEEPEGDEEGEAS